LGYPGAAAVLAVGLLGGAALARGQAAVTPTPAAGEKAVAKGDTAPKCADCHTDLVQAFAKNPHGRYPKDKKPDPNEICTTCHGDGTKHMEAGGDASLIGTLKGVSGSQDCLSCHDKLPNGHDSFATGFHSNTAAVNCLSCHSIHKSAPKTEHLLAKAPGALCETCHTTQSASFRNKPYVHRLDRGGMTCLDCHDPHARQGEPVKMTFQGELPCLNCHAEKRGPFVYDHVTGSGGTCLSCHQPHGSNNPNMLLWAQVGQLCLSCHSQTGGPPTLGSQPPSFHNLSLPRYRNCTTCHVAVHGSNLSPQLLK
jgi:DmsE family decaheme c-type cytochrome